MKHHRNRDWEMRVYRYGAVLPTPHPETWPEGMQHEAAAMQQLWNDLVVLWRQSSERYDALLAETPDLATAQAELVQLDQDVEAAVQAVKQARQRYRKKTHPRIAVLNDVATRFKEARKAQRQQVKELRHVVRDTVKPQIRALTEQLWEDVAAKVKASPLVWPHRELVEASFRNGLERFWKRLGGPPRFHIRHDQAHFAYRFTGGGIPWDQLFSPSQRMARLTLPSEAAWAPALSQNERRRQGFTSGYLRVAKDTTIPLSLTLHTRPPDGAIVKKMALIGTEVCQGGRRRTHATHAVYDVPPRWRWEVQLSCEVPPTTVPKRVELPVAGLDLAWRMLDDGRIRLGVLWDGVRAEELYFPPAILENWRYGQVLQQRCDQFLEATKAALRQLWTIFEPPESVAENLHTLTRVRHAGLLRVRHTIADLEPGTPGRAASLAVLDEWETRTYVWYTEKRGLEARQLRRRTWEYANLAMRLGNRFQALAVEDLDLSRLARKDTTAESPRLQAAAKYRHLVGLSELRKWLGLQYGKTGMEVIVVDPAYTTLDCTVCGARLPQQDGTLLLVCPNGHVYDQDENAAIQLYRRAFGVEEVA